MSVTEIYSRARARWKRYCDAKTVDSSVNELLSEEDWHKSGKPYFKIWPRILESLCNVRIDISGEFLKVPFKVFEIRLPRTRNCMREGDGPVLKSILVHYLEKGRSVLPPLPDNQVGQLMVFYRFDADKEEHSEWYFGLGIFRDEKIEDTIVRYVREKSIHYDDFEPSLPLVQSIMRVAIGTAFFGIDRHELVMPDIPRKIIQRFYQAQKDRNSTEVQKILRQAKEMGHFGWKVGSEIDLPTADVHYLDRDGVRETTDRQLSFGHIRRAHMRLQPYGPKDQPSEYKLIFLYPTPVRPDLPFRESHGYLIGRREE